MKVDRSNVDSRVIGVNPPFSILCKATAALLLGKYAVQKKLIEYLHTDGYVVNLIMLLV